MDDAAAEVNGKDRDAEARKVRMGEICGILKATNRPGVDGVIAGLVKLGFFRSPASTRFHLSCRGGLAAHSLCVYRQAMALRQAQLDLAARYLSPAHADDLAKRLPEDSVAIAALLHDVCKAGIYRLEKRNRKNAAGQWESYDAYRADYADFPLGHGEKSVIRLLRWGLEMTDDEILAIRWHMHRWDMPESSEAMGNFSAAGNACPLLGLLIAADGLSARVFETQFDETGNLKPAGGTESAPGPEKAV